MFNVRIFNTDRPQSVEFEIETDTPANKLKLLCINRGVARAVFLAPVRDKNSAGVGGWHRSSLLRQPHRLHQLWANNEAAMSEMGAKFDESLRDIFQL